MKSDLIQTPQAHLNALGHKCNRSNRKQIG